MKPIMAFAFVFLSFSVRSQSFTGVFAGGGYSTIKGDDIANGVSVSGKITVNVGVKTELKFSDKLFLMCVMEYCGKGYKAKDGIHTNNVSLDYIQFPFSLLYKLPLDEDAKNQILIGAGPYAGFGINYKTKWTTTDPLVANSEGEENGNFADYGIRITDFGLTGLIGAQLGSKIQLIASYQPGLVNIFYSTDFGLVKNRRIGLQLVYAW